MAEPAVSAPAARPILISRVPRGGTNDPDEILGLFIDWAAEAGFDLYPAQEQALLEIMGGRHVILNTPTGLTRLELVAPAAQGIDTGGFRAAWFRVSPDLPSRGARHRSGARWAL